MYDKVKLLDILTNQNYKTIDDEGKVFPPSHEVYRRISETLTDRESFISRKHIYTVLKNDRSGIYSAVLQAFQINIDNDKNKSKDSTNLTDLNNSSITEKRTVKKFNLLISEEKWSLVKPTHQTYGRHGRSYITLQPGKWTDVFAEKIWQQTNLPCAITFKRAKIFTNSDAKYYAQFTGRCKECKAQLVGILGSKPRKASDVIFKCTLTGFRTDITHKKKRQLRGPLREKIASELLDGNQCASVWRNKEANKLMTFGDNIPPILYDATVLRKAKQTELEKRLNLNDTDPIKNLQVAKYTKFSRIIRNIGIDPFYCMYWTEEQHIMYKKSHKQDVNCFLAIDATGSIAKKIHLPNDERSPHIFLYEIVCVSDVGNFPIFQMVSTRQDASMISYFLAEIIRNGAPVPRMVVSDFGRAILIAVARIFAGCTNLSHYLHICYNIIHNQYIDNILSCYIRLDVSHFISMIAKWDCLKGKPVKIRQFFLRCLGKAYQIENFTQLQNFIKSVLIVALSEEIGSNENDVLLQSEMHLRNLNDTIKGITIEEEPVENMYDYDDEMDALHENINWTDWAENMFHEAEEIAHTSSNGNVVNAFYNIEAAKNIKRLLSYVPLWTGIMRTYFRDNREIVTSSYVEAEFAELKTRVFKNKLPTRVDKFVSCHIEYLEGRLKLERGTIHEKTASEDNFKDKSLSVENTNYIKESKSPMPNMVFDYCESLNEIENWRSKVKIDNTQNVTQKTRTNYLTPCPDWDFIDSHKAIGIPVMRNGSLCNAVVVNKQHIVVRETCAFDSILHVIASGTGMRNNYKKSISKLMFTNVFFKLIIDILKRGKIISNDYSKRATILCNIPIFKEQHWKIFARDISTLNANCNAAHLAQYLFQDIPSYTSSYTCLNCGHNHKRTYAIHNINVDIILKSGLSAMQEAINDINKNNLTQCSACKQPTNYAFSYGPHLIFDISIVTDTKYLKPKMGISKLGYELNSAPKNIQLDNKNYCLAGIISYTQYGSENNEGHYIAFTYTGLTWHKYDDMMSKRTTAKGVEEIYPHVIIYIEH